mmetsp:Transcript_35150/g.100640  ORF Transcript_35150/g.100640 Transcript_35150/m.100640 type:complete len:197 (-) Transcript_35150:50-640(-)
MLFARRRVALSLCAELLVLFAAVSFADGVSLNDTCETRVDCSGHGDCVNQRCKCDAYWYGAMCNQSVFKKGLCTDTRCGGAAKLCCEGSTALQKKSMCVGSVTCDSCCGWVGPGWTYNGHENEEDCGPGFTCVAGFAYGCAPINDSANIVCCSDGQQGLSGISKWCNDEDPTKLPFCPARGATGGGCIRDGAIFSV